MTRPNNSDTARYGYGTVLADIVTLALAAYFFTQQGPTAVDDYGRFALAYVCIDSMSLVFTSMGAVIYSKRINPLMPVLSVALIPLLVFNMRKVLPVDGYWEFVAAVSVSILIRVATAYRNLPKDLPDSGISGYLGPRLAPVMIALPVGMSVAFYLVIKNPSGPSPEFTFLFIFYMVHSLLSLPPAQRWFERWAYRWYP
jgi:hypothetical protein